MLKMKLSYILLFLTVGLVVIISACTKDTVTNVEGMCDTSAVTYSSDVADILNASCAITGCHVSGSQTPLMSDFASASAASTAPNFLGAIKHEAGFTPMPFPPGSSQLEPCKIEMLEAWVEAGSPE